MRIAFALIWMSAAAARAQSELPPISEPSPTAPSSELPPITLPANPPPAKPAATSAPTPNVPATSTAAPSTTASTSTSASSPAASTSASLPSAAPPAATSANETSIESSIAPPPNPPIAWTQPPAVPETVERSLELQLRAGVSVATIQVDGAAQTAFLPGGLIEFHQGMLCAGLLFDLDPSLDSGTSTVGEDRSGWHLGALLGPSFQITETLRLELLGELGVHVLTDNVSSLSSSSSTTDALPYLGVRPALSVQFGSGKIVGAVGAALFFRVDAAQKQSDGIPDDGGHQLGAEAFLSLRIALL